MQPTKRLYWLDDDSLEADAVIIAVRGNRIVLDQTCFYAGGGGQPADHGTITLVSSVLNVTDMLDDADGVLWHQCDLPAPAEFVGERAHLQVDPTRRWALSRYHTVLHVLNTIALRDYDAPITGARIGVDYAHIDFKWDGFSAALGGVLERKVNDVLAANRPLRAYWLAEEEFFQKPELRRTLKVLPPIIDGQVRVVEIEGFDAQACGGTHVHDTGQLGQFSITRTENKGRINKRIYVRLDGPYSHRTT